MERYLIFDSYCSGCSSLAHTIEEVAAGKLKAVSIASEQAKRMLEQVFPNGWDHRPYFVTVKQDKVSVSTGYKIALQLGMLLGFKKGWQVYNLAKQYGVKIPFGRQRFSSGKRKFIRNTAIFVGTLFCVGSGFPNLKALVAQEVEKDGSESNLSILEPEEAERFRTIVTESNDYKDFKTQLIPGFVEGETIALRKGSGEIFVSIPITYPDQSQETAFTKIITKDQSVLGSTAFSLENASTGKRGRLWNNGKLISDVTLDDQGTVLSGGVFQDTPGISTNRIGAKFGLSTPRNIVGGRTQISLSGNNFVSEGNSATNEFIKQLSDSELKTSQNTSFLDSSRANAVSLSCVNRCLSSAGIPAVLLGLIGTGCAIACAFTAGLGCITCLSFVLGGYIGVIRACVKRC